MKTKDFSLKVEKVSDEGTFEGYASIAGNVDSYGEIVMPGAFAASLARHKREGTKPLLLWQHNPDQPIGVWEEMAEDGKGLWGKGRFSVGVRQADEARILLKDGALRGLSIGYREIKVEPDGNNRKLVELDLVEASIVSFPANRRARVEVVKSEAAEAAIQKLSAGDRLTEREWEALLKAEPFGLTNSQAERAVRVNLKRGSGEPNTTAEPSVARLVAIAKAAAAGIAIRK